MMQFISFAQRKLFLLSARSGMDAWPSCEMELARRTGNGTTPAAKSVTKIMCGPDSGMMPISVASRIIRAVLLLIQCSISMYWRPMPSTRSTLNVHAKMVGRCLQMMCFQRCSSTKWSEAKRSTKRTMTLSPAKRTFIQSSLRRLMLPCECAS